MRDMLLLVIVAAMFVFGYFVIDRLDRFLEKLRLEEDLPADESEREISDSAEVENPCLQCYNIGCRDRVRYPAGCSAGQEEPAWRQPDKIRIGFRGQMGRTAGHRGN